MEKTWRPTVAGILDLVSGVFALISVIGLIIGIIVIGGPTYFPGKEAIPGFVPSILWSLTIFYLIITILAFIGGVYALQRQKWGLALAGSIAITVFWFFVGIPAIVFTAQSKNEFE